MEVKMLKVVRKLGCGAIFYAYAYAQLTVF